MWVVKSNDGICRFPTIEEAMDYMYKEGISSARVYKEIPDVGDSSNQSLCDYYCVNGDDGSELPDGKGGDQ
mgnify:CR=1 FL=1